MNSPPKKLPQIQRSIPKQLIQKVDKELNKICTVIFLFVLFCEILLLLLLLLFYFPRESPIFIDMIGNSRLVAMDLKENALKVKGSKF